MRAYQERAARVELEFPLELMLEGERLIGTCENLSESGLLARFPVPLDVWTTGEVDLHFGTHLLGVRVRVARVVGLQAGLTFQCADERQRQEIRDLIQAARIAGRIPEQL